MNLHKQRQCAVNRKFIDIFLFNLKMQKLAFAITKMNKLLTNNKNRALGNFEKKMSID
jgi:hypothetical protein